MHFTSTLWIVSGLFSNHRQEMITKKVMLKIKKYGQVLKNANLATLFIWHFKKWHHSITRPWKHGYRHQNYGPKCTRSDIMLKWSKWHIFSKKQQQKCLVISLSVTHVTFFQDCWWIGVAMRLSQKHTCTPTYISQWIKES